MQRSLKRFLQMEAVQKCENLVISSRKNLMLKNAYLGAKIAFDTAANELSKFCPIFEIGAVQRIANLVVLEKC